MSDFWSLEELQRLGPAAVEPLISEFGVPGNREWVLRVLADLPPAFTLEPLLHLLGTERCRDAAKEALLVLSPSLIENALNLLLAELAERGLASPLSRRCLGVLWPETRDLLIRLSESGKYAQAARDYVAAREPLSLESWMRPRYPNRDWALQHLPTSGTAWEVLEKMLAGRPWLADRMRQRDEALLAEYRGDLIIAALSAGRDGVGSAGLVLEQLGRSAAGLGHVLDGLALPECACDAREFLDRVWPASAAAANGATPATPGLVEYYVRSRGPGEFERLALNLDRRDDLSATVERLAALGLDAIPALAKVVGRAGYSRGALVVADRILSEVVWAALSRPTLRDDALKCLAGSEFTLKVFTDPIGSILRSPGFDHRQWPALVRRNAPEPWDSPSTPGFSHALHLCCLWEVMPPRERLTAVKKIQSRIDRLMQWATQVYEREAADIHLTARELVVEHSRRWYVKQPVAPMAVARMTPEVQRELFQIKHFLRYICATRIFGMLKDFARETFRLLPD